MRHAVFFAQGRQLGDGLPLLALAVGGVDHRGVQHLAGAVDDRHLAPVGIAGVQPHGHVALYRRLEQQRLQVQRELSDSALVGAVRQGGPRLALQRRIDQPVIGVLTGGLDEFHGRRAGLYHRPPQCRQRGLPVQQYRDGEQPLFFAPVDGQDLVPRQLWNGLFKVVVQSVHAVLLRGGKASQPSLPHQQAPQCLADVRVVADDLRDDVVGALQCVGRGLHALLRIDVRLCGRLRRGTVLLLRQQQLRQGLQPLLPGHRGAGAPLLLVGTVQVLHLRQRGGAVDGRRQRIGQLALSLDGGLDLLPPLVQVP